jgi:diaminopimelate epimerase
MTAIAFDKYEGLGNDFVLVEVADETEIDADAARALCDRRFGVGGDGVLLVLPARTAGADARMKVINADGSVPEMCGNGLRCAALHVARRRDARRRELRVDTDAGVLACAIEDANGEGMVTVDMGIVRVTGETTIDVGGEPIPLTLADAGNPHAITFRPTSRADFERLGPVLATHPRFPHGTNVEFARVSDSGIDVTVWERGVGPTLACGTGACATLAVAVAKGLAPSDAVVEVRLPGGALFIRIESSSGHAHMRGPARHVFSGRAPGGR